ncbi:nickel pincer cofactor biosynthesis protein LarC [Cyanobium sp. Morenito 9A2]|uniref:nickel pincer cofactor biosynthesis protein LarC n=1 Tax=Cyanobium sp. Morenito 9A2 TaxID=2823718 RepID=UPI0020CB702C|nr:nickel pincer cofactor biosynthesis protein LarC [Cyanobium sp. Morenito 9A2]MCP9848426.1 nickel pincer cofactor biosynthesis protein LarC [Cyanobium sp. Morenito 9A2]
MTLAYVDCPTGLAGDMLLAALFDLGLPRERVEEPLAQVGLAGGYRLQWQEGRSGGLRGLTVHVEALEPQPLHRPWSAIRTLLETSPLEGALRERVVAVFQWLAEAEGAVHGLPPEQVHFHEVGAIDALVDVVGVCAGLLHFGVDELICAPPPAGHGTVRTAHGPLPLPAPAVLELAVRAAVPLASSAGFPPGELTTPTGLALMVTWASRFAQAPALVPQRVGMGLGTRTLDRPNLLRLWLAPSSPQQGGPGLEAGEILEPLLLQQAQVDDASPEDLAFLMEELRGAGGLEVFSQPIAMKKGRPAALISVLVAPERAGTLRRVWWTHSSSLGVREQLQQRWSLPRSSRSLATPWGPVRIKEAHSPTGRRTMKPEYEDLAALARRHGLPLHQLRAAVQAAWASEERP